MNAWALVALLVLSLVPPAEPLRLAIRNGTGRDLVVTYDQRTIAIPAGSTAAWNLPAIPEFDGGRVRINVTATDGVRSWLWEWCACSFASRAGTRYVIVQIAGPLSKGTAE